VRGPDDLCVAVRPAHPGRGAMSTTPMPVVRLSPLDAAQQALDYTRRQLFPFRFDRWLALGFVAFLDQCGRAGGVGQFPTGGGLPEEVGERGGPGPVLSEAGAWLAAHVMMMMAVAAVALVLILCLTALVLWINSRGV